MKARRKAWRFIGGLAIVLIAGLAIATPLVLMVFPRILGRRPCLRQ
jgi:hypothetical protein